VKFPRWTEFFAQLITAVAVPAASPSGPGTTALLAWIVRRRLDDLSF